MKKTVTLPDGTTEVLEGTAEEIATHERLIRERTRTDTPGKKKPDVLKGAPDVVETGTEPVRLDEETIETIRKLLEKSAQPYSPGTAFPLAPTCWRCGRQGCTDLHLFDAWPPGHTISANAIH